VEIAPPPGGEGMTATSTPQVSRNAVEVSSGRENALRITREFIQRGANVVKVVVNVGTRLLTVSDMIFIYPGKTRGQASMLNLEALRTQGL
jgi:hypothetical protein